MNKQGFAVTGILYTLLLIGIISLNLLLFNLLNRKTLLDQIKTDTVNAVEKDSDFEYLLERINKLESMVSIDTIYPVGSIYITTSSSDPSSIFDGTKWERYGVGKTLVSTDKEVNQTGGSNTATLAIANLPGHSHTVTSSGSVSSTFTGSAVDSGSTGNGYSIEHTYTTRDTSEAGNHKHTISHTYIPNGSNEAWSPTNIHAGSIKEFTDDAGNHTHTVRDYYANRISGVEAHKHSVTAKGTVSSTFTGSSTTTNTVGNGQAFSVQNPYITVYMWKRVS